MTRVELALMLTVCLATGACTPGAGTHDAARSVAPGTASPPAAPGTNRATHAAPPLLPGIFAPPRFIDIGAPIDAIGRDSARRI